MKKVLIVAAGVLSAALITRHSWALGLGELTLHSYLNEPFRAEVALLEAGALDDNDVHVDLASDTEFERLGVSRDFFLTRINFQLESDQSGRRIVLTTETPLREPYLDFIIEARWPDGRLLREYTVLIDLPPRPVVTETLDVAAVTEPSSDELATFSETGTMSSADGGYAADASVRPAPGTEYLVTNNDTLWRIASEAAPAGASVEQTMLEIVASNPAAFQAGNINGLKSGYVLQIPEAADIQIDVMAARDEVALQNEEWAQGVARESQGLTLVADAESAEETGSAPAGSNAARDTGIEADLDTDAIDETSDQPPLAAQDLEALVATVSQLQDSVDSLEAQLAQRDEELASLRSALAEQQAQSPVPVLVETTDATSPVSTPASEPLPIWPFLAGLGTLLVGGGLLIWRRKRESGSGELTAQPDHASTLPADEVEETTAVSRLSDPQIMASKAVEEAQIYIAYGRTDQAVEVLSDALAEGLTSPSLNMCLLECYVELEQFEEAGALLGRLEQGGNPELLERARQMLLDAGMTLTMPSGEAAIERHEERVEESDEVSVLSELSFSAEPAFGLNEGQDSPHEEEDAETVTFFEESAPNQVDSAAGHDQAASFLESAEPSVSVDLETDEGPIDSHASSKDDPLPSEDHAAELEVSHELTGDEQDLQLAPLEEAVDAPAPESGADVIEPKEAVIGVVDSPDTSGLSLTPLEDEASDASAAPAEAPDMGESIYGVETNPVDSKLDLARAYLDMGDEDGARPVLMEVIKEGDLAQQAEARELLLRLEAS